jgi:holo-[acyl-carrier protein] synthase
MNISIGIDCEEIERFQKVLDKPNLINRIFTKKEIEYCNKKIKPNSHFAVRFAGKEAVIKAFSDMNIQVHMKDIEILNNSLGVPQVKVKSIDGFIIKISLSHSENIAIAQAIVINQEDEKNK